MPKRWRLLFPKPRVGVRRRLFPWNAASRQITAVAKGDGPFPEPQSVGQAKAVITVVGLPAEPQSVERGAVGGAGLGEVFGLLKGAHGAAGAGAPLAVGFARLKACVVQQSLDLVVIVRA